MIMKRILLLMLTVVITTVMMAGNVTPDEALQKATAFVQNRIASGKHMKKAPGSVVPQLTLAKELNGLYVFNVSDNAGFVIVSNDDSVDAILGYSDSGIFQPNRIPENMKAWLQGYADEIAWLNKRKAEDPSFAEDLPCHTPTVVKTPVSPLLRTTWDQGTPYNNLCPEYTEGSKSATGCVATAMAQAMYYTEMKAGSTTTYTAAEIAGYTSQTNSLSVDAVPAGTPIYWSNMIEDYRSGYTTSQATAIAQLMLYCGTSVTMDYGQSSGSQTYKVCDALKAYFNYEPTTTMYVQRSFYSYNKWIELIYHELKNGRVVVYGGQSSGGGHEFICDGYQGEDYFHINWGWSGSSDGYFKLSVLSPKAQGIGGSSSTDGFHYGQDAVIGIQKSSGSGTVLDVTPNTVNLSLNSVTFSDNATQGEPVTVTIDLKNNSSDDYDGDIGARICYYYAEQWYTIDDVCSDFLIPAGVDSKVIQLTFTPRYNGTYGLVIYRPAEEPGYIAFIDNIYKIVDVAAATGSTSLGLTVSGYNISSPFTFGYPSTTVYGTSLQGTVTLKNNNEETYLGSVGWQLGDADNYLVAQDVRDLSLPAGESIELPFATSGLTVGETYKLYLLYTKDGSWKGSYVQLNIQPAILTYLNDGTEQFAKPSTSYDALTNAPLALAVDLTDTGVTSVIPNEQVNTVYIYSGTKPDGLDGKNVVKYEGGAYTAENIVLTDDKDFYSPVDFTATKVEFVYDNPKEADGVNGWNTLVLPFEVTKVTADDEEIDWFHSSTDTGKNFWVKSFAGDDNTTVYFDYVDQMKGNVPYIVALPGDHWGAKWDLSQKEIKFIGENVVVSKSSNLASTTGTYFRFVGSTIEAYPQNIYLINDNGNAFELEDRKGISPFRAYFSPTTFDRSLTRLGIGSMGGDVTGITQIDSNQDAPDVESLFYDLQGRIVPGVPTQRGIYIKNGKKIVIKK